MGPTVLDRTADTPRLPGLVNIVLALAMESLAVQAAACIVALAISQAPGWRRARIGALLAGTAGLYSLLNMLGALYPGSALAVVWVTSSNLLVAAVHVGAWIWFSFSDEQGRWSSVPRNLRWFVLGHFSWSALVSLSGNAVDTSRMTTVSVPWLGVSFDQASLTPLATLSAVITLGMLVISFAEQLRQARRGVVGAKWNAYGFLLFVSCAVEEILVSANVVNFIYLAGIGSLGIVMPMVAQFVQRFIGDAHRLQVLTHALEEDVQLATEERDAAREALAVQERFAALGRMAGGVGHEINNPHASAGSSPDCAPTRCRANPRSIRSHQRSWCARRSRRRWRRSERARRSAPTSRPRRRCWSTANGCCRRSDTRTTAGGDALIEIRDNGFGFPPSLLARLGEPFVTTQAPGAGVGLGILLPPAARA